MGRRSRSEGIALGVGAIAAMIALTAAAGACGNDEEPASPTSSSTSSSGASTSSGGSTSSGSVSTGSSGTASGSSSGSASDAATDATDGASAAPSATLGTFVVDGTVKPITTIVCQQAGQDYQINGVNSAGPVVNVRALFRRNGAPLPGTYVATASVGDTNANVQYVDEGTPYITPALGSAGAGTGTVTVVDRAGKLGIFWNDVSVSGAAGTRTVSANYTCP